MVKADVKRNYYADLELTNTATVEEIKKQYRKLALAYHPDRNAGREEECIPKFQAIQAAHEVLTDPVQKTDYDLARRSASLYPTFNRNRPASGPTGNPYQATSDFPPPPRRTQPGTYNRPPNSNPRTNASTPGGTPNGADRFTNFPKPASAQRPDAAQDRTNMFRAWQNMNTPQNGQGRTGQAAGGGANAGTSAKGAPTSRRPQPPPRQGTTYPTEDDIKAGMNYTKGPPPKPPPRNNAATDANWRSYKASTDAEDAEKQRSAWQSFQASAGQSPGVGRSKTTRTPRKGGFDPSAPGSDERPASGSYNNSRHKSEDMGRPFGGMPPPPPGPPPRSTGSTPGSPEQSRQRPHLDPLRPFRSRDEDAPYSEGNRRRTPYTSFSGEKTDFGSDMRRSASTRDTTKLHEQATKSESGQGRHRSTSPLRQPQYPGHASSTNQRSSMNDSSDSDSSDSPHSPRTNKTPGSTNPYGRPMATPRARGPQTPSAGEPLRPATATDGAQSDNEAFKQRQQSNGNMYVNPSSVPSKRKNPEPSFSYATSWVKSMFGGNTGGYVRDKVEQQLKESAAPSWASKWALPSSILPPSAAFGKKQGFGSVSTGPEAKNDAALPALYALREWFNTMYGRDEGLDIDAFRGLIAIWKESRSTGFPLLDEALTDVLHKYPEAHTSRDSNSRRKQANAPGYNSFNFPAGTPDVSSPGAKSRSEENINTKFSPGGWSGKFQGTPDYFAPPPPAGGTKKSASPSRRQQGPRSNLRSATTPGLASPNGNTGGFDGACESPPPHLNNSHADAGQQPQVPQGSTHFSKDEWEKTFKEASWVWPPPPPGNPPQSPSKTTRRTPGPSRKSSRANTRAAAAGANAQPHVLDEAEEPTTVEEPKSAVPDDIDAMDIDNTPPATTAPTPVPPPPAAASTTHNVSTKPARTVSVPMTPWRQQQQNPQFQQQYQQPRQQNGTQHPQPQPSQAPDNLKTNLSDFANVAPFAQYTQGLSGFSDLSSTLPFKSAPQNTTVPTDEAKPLSTPPLPKAPEAPAKLSKRAWNDYLARFAAYLRAYTTWSETMLSHFAARNFQVDERLRGSNNWLEAQGDVVNSGSGDGGNGGGLVEGMLGGWGGYMKGVREDAAVREKWVLGCERHEVACGGFERVRERVRGLAEGGTLQE